MKSKAVLLFASGREAGRGLPERRRDAHETEPLLRAIEQTADSVFITDRNGTITYVNPAFEALTGFSAAEAIGATPRLFKSGRQGARFYEKLWATVGYASLEDYLVRAWEGNFLRRNAEDLLSMIETWYQSDISANPIYNVVSDAYAVGSVTTTNNISIIDLTLSGETMFDREAIDPILTPEGLRLRVPDYVGGADASDPQISPIFGDLRGLPPLLIQVG
jgi:PAS domain-containing protein